VCGFPNHVQLIEFTTGGLQSSCRNMINGNRMHLSSIWSLTAKGLNTYVNKKFKKPVLDLSLCHFVRRMLGKMFYLINFRIRL
jgi:hypothetical protein